MARYLEFRKKTPLSVKHETGHALHFCNLLSFLLICHLSVSKQLRSILGKVSLVSYIQSLITSQAMTDEN